MVNFLPKVKMKIVVADNIFNHCVKIIIQTAQTNKISNGKIFVFDLVCVVRIRTGKQDEEAI